MSRRRCAFRRGRPAAVRGARRRSGQPARSRSSTRTTGSSRKASERSCLSTLLLRVLRGGYFASATEEVRGFISRRILDDLVEERTEDLAEDRPGAKTELHQ